MCGSMLKQLPSYYSKSNGVIDAVKDLSDGLKRHELWRSLGMHEIKQLYHGSFLGAAWIILSFLLFAAALILFFGGLTSQGASWYATYVITGLWVFQFLAVIVSSGCTVFITAKGWLQSARMPISLFMYKSVYRNLYNLALTGAALIIILLVLDHKLTIAAFMAIPGIIAILYNALWVTLLLGLLATRYRDLQHLVQTFMRFAIFITPIIWVPEDIGNRAIIAQFNPFTHFVEIVRDPILNGMVPQTSWWVVLTFSVIGTLVTFLLFAAWRKHLVFWI